MRIKANPWWGRLLFCLPFFVVVGYVQSFHAELVNNAQVSWQYVQTGSGKVYLAVDAFSPSGIKMESIRAAGHDVARSFQLVNYPRWFKGKENFPGLEQFQNRLDLYLPYNKDFSILYTNRWYTFLYEWIGPAADLPDEESLGVRYRNVGTGNVYDAKRESGVKILTAMAADQEEILFDLEVLYPRRIYKQYLIAGALNIATDNLQQVAPGKLRLVNPEQKEYSIAVRDMVSQTRESLHGAIGQCAFEPCQVYYKNRENQSGGQGEAGRIFTFGSLVRHLAMLLVIVYLMMACWGMGRVFLRWLKLESDGPVDHMASPLLAGIIILTYFLWGIGILNLLYWPVVVGVLAVILVTCIDTSSCRRGATDFLLRGKQVVFRSPWLLLPLGLCLSFLLFHLSYCFIPATYIDGSGDVTNSYLPLLNDYILFHNFKAAVQNSTIGIGPQALDVLRTVAKMLAGEPGVYLWSVGYLLLAAAGIYLIGQRIFQSRFMVTALVVIGLFFYQLFPVAIHLGKWHAAVLGVLLMALGAIRYSHHPRNFLLPALFWGFLVSQYSFFAPVVFVYYLFIFFGDLADTKRKASTGLHLRSLAFFVFLVPAFYVKLILEVGTCFPPGATPEIFHNFFIQLNRNNPYYPYIDNSYIRIFYAVNHLSMDTAGAAANFFPQLVWNLWLNVDYLFLLCFIAFMRKNRDINLYLVLVFALVTVLEFLFPTNMRIKIYCVFPLLIVQWVLLERFVLWVGQAVRQRSGWDWLVKPVLAVALLLLGFTHLTEGKIQWRVHEHMARQREYLQHMVGDYKVGVPHWYRDYVLPTALGGKSWYEYLTVGGADRYFDYAMLVRQQTSPEDTILIIPVRYHSDIFRRMTARHALGSVIFQEQMPAIMEDLAKLKIGYLSSIPFTYQDYNPFYSPLLDDQNFSRYCHILFAYKDCKFYQIIYDGSNLESYPSPLNVKDRPFVPMKGKYKNVQGVVYRDAYQRVQMKKFE